MTGMKNDKQQLFPMLWHNILVYVFLWLTAASLLTWGILSVTGAVHGNAQTREALYLLAEGLRRWDIIVGMIAIVLGVFAALICFMLANYKKGAPGLLVAFNVITFICILCYFIALNKMIDGGMGRLGIGLFLAMVSSVIQLYANIVYYDRRMSLFVN